MRLNVYTEEMTNECEVVTKEYVSSRTGEKMTNYGIRVFVKSHPDLHHVPGRDDDRSAVTFWCGADPAAMMHLVQSMGFAVHERKRERS